MFYRDRWPSHLIPLLINRIGADPKPWEPSFDGTRLLQEIRDTVYENDEHTIDEGGWVDKLVSVIYLLVAFVVNLLLFRQSSEFTSGVILSAKQLWTQLPRTSIQLNSWLTRWTVPSNWRHSETTATSN